MKTISIDGKTILVTGAAGFIGSYLAVKLLKETSGSRIIGLDNMNDYYDPALKEYRISVIRRTAEDLKSSFEFEKGSISDRAFLEELFAKYRFDTVVNLAAQAGVRYSIEHPDVYMESNVTGFFNVLEMCRKYPVEHLVYASSSSVYGKSPDVPFSEDARADEPVSLYAATKRSNELFANAYADLYGIPCTGLRFFTVYGPAGRPDMFYYKAASKLVRGEKICLYDNGESRRDYTYIDDITEGIFRVMGKAPEAKIREDGSFAAPHAIYNIGCGKPVVLKNFINILFEELKRIGKIPEEAALKDFTEFAGPQPGDVPLTFADCGKLKKDFGYQPRTDIREGVRRFAEWFARQERGV